MKCFKDFPEEVQKKIVQNHWEWLTKEVFCSDRMKMEEEIKNNLMNFRIKWNFVTSWINFDINDQNKIVYSMEDFSWKREQIAELSKCSSVIGESRQIKEDIDWFEKVGGMIFFINVGMHANTFELLSSSRFVLTHVLTVEEKAKRIEILLEEFEDNEKITERIHQIADTKTTSRLRKQMEAELDEIVKLCFFEKRKKWSKKIEIYLDKDFSKVKDENQKIVEKHQGVDNVAKKLREGNSIYFTAQGEPLKKSP